MGLGICFDERYEPVTRVMHYTPDTNLTSHFAMRVIVLKDNDRLFPTLTGVVHIARVKVTIVAIVSADWTDAILFRQQLNA
jgi:hypothetical protein